MTVEKQLGRSRFREGIEKCMRWCTVPVLVAGLALSGCYKQAPPQSAARVEQEDMAQQNRGTETKWGWTAKKTVRAPTRVDYWTVRTCLGLLKSTERSEEDRVWNNTVDSFIVAVNREQEGIKDPFSTSTAYERSYIFLSRNIGTLRERIEGIGGDVLATALEDSPSRRARIIAYQMNSRLKSAKSVDEILAVYRYYDGWMETAIDAHMKAKAKMGESGLKPADNIIGTTVVETTEPTFADYYALDIALYRITISTSDSANAGNRMMAGFMRQGVDKELNERVCNPTATHAGYDEALSFILARAQIVIAGTEWLTVQAFLEDQRTRGFVQANADLDAQYQVYRITGMTLERQRKELQGCPDQ
jgi:hypothetical protein